jgi:hypothetical protein
MVMTAVELGCWRRCGGGPCEENSLFYQNVVILVACSSGFWFTELHFGNEITTYPAPQISQSGTDFAPELNQSE